MLSLLNESNFVISPNDRIRYISQYLTHWFTFSPDLSTVAHMHYSLTVESFEIIRCLSPANLGYKGVFVILSSHASSSFELAFLNNDHRIRYWSCHRERTLSNHWWQNDCGCEEGRREEETQSWKEVKEEVCLFSQTVTIEAFFSQVVVKSEDLPDHLRGFDASKDMNVLTNKQWRWRVDDR